LVFYGPSLGGKTTALRWLYGKVEGLQKGEFTAIEDETNRTLFFDYVPMSAGGRVLFDVFTVAGQKRHRHQRKVVLQGTDGILFVADSSPDQRDENT
jgi:signal recognition particle receptor subunit beta